MCLRQLEELYQKSCSAVQKESRRSSSATNSYDNKTSSESEDTIEESTSDEDNIHIGLNDDKLGFQPNLYPSNSQRFLHLSNSSSSLSELATISAPYSNSSASYITDLFLQQQQQITTTFDDYYRNSNTTNQLALDMKQISTDNNSSNRNHVTPLSPCGIEDDPSNNFSFDHFYFTQQYQQQRHSCQQMQAQQPQQPHQSDVQVDPHDWQDIVTFFSDAPYGQSLSQQQYQPHHHQQQQSLSSFPSSPLLTSATSPYPFSHTNSMSSLQLSTSLTANDSFSDLDSAFAPILFSNSPAF